jgi:hypothetical protein
MHMSSHQNKTFDVINQSTTLGIPLLLRNDEHNIPTHFHAHTFQSGIYMHTNARRKTAERKIDG